MPNISIFQHLPVHIAEAIVRYCISKGPKYGYHYEEVKEDEHVWTTMYRVSFLWQELALKHFFQRLTIDISAGTGTVQFKYQYLPPNIRIDNTSYNYVKWVDVVFPYPCHTNNKRTSSDSHSAWPKDLIFPAARRLAIELTGPLNKMLDKHGSLDNEQSYWITQRLRTSFPRLQEVSIAEPFSFYSRSSNSIDDQWKADELLLAIFDTVKVFDIMLFSHHPVSDYSFIRNGTGLTNLKYSYMDQVDLFHYIVGHSAQTLESLKYCSNSCGSAASLIINGKGQPIVYPRLRRLAFYSDLQYDASLMLKFDISIAPFPALQQLRWSAAYIFEDDTLFRGNSDTLERLDISVDAVCVGTLERLHVFAVGKYPQLAYINVREIDHDYSIQPNTDNSFIRFVNGLITPATKSVTLDYTFTDLQFIDTVAESPHSSNIHLLDLTETTLSLKDIIAIVTLLPNLVILGCHPTGDDDTQSRPTCSYVNDIYTTYYPLSHRLKYLGIIQGIEDSVSPVVQTALALSILCPNFIKALVPPDEKAEYCVELEAHINSGIYDDHKYAVKRLLRSMS